MYALAPADAPEFSMGHGRGSWSRSLATAPVLILVGFLMASLITKIDFADIEEGFPALLAIVLMPLTYSITVGIGAGFVLYTSSRSPAVKQPT